jgi:hypothetical protein
MPELVLEPLATMASVVGLPPNALATPVAHQTHMSQRNLLTALTALHPVHVLTLQRMIKHVACQGHAVQLFPVNVLMVRLQQVTTLMPLCCAFQMTVMTQMTSPLVAEVNVPQ